MKTEKREEKERKWKIAQIQMGSLELKLFFVLKHELIFFLNICETNLIFLLQLDINV